MTQPTSAPPLISESQTCLTARSVLIGLLGALLLAGLTPVNDLVLRNTAMVGNFLPLGVIAFLLLLILGFNAVFPRIRLRAAELSLVLIMMMAAGSVASAGLMKWVPATLVGFVNNGSQNAAMAKTLDRLELPAWIFPSFNTTSWSTRGGEPVIQHYIGRSTDGSVPWGPWIKPAVAWGGFFGAILTAGLCLMVIVRHQWAVNERLAFPLATVYTSLVETPEPGHRLNTLFRSRGFWIAFCVVLGVHLLNGAAAYFPNLPTIPLKYNMISMLTDSPLDKTDSLFKANTLYFSIIGVCYFVQTRLALSLWLFYVLRQLIGASAAAAGTEIRGEVYSDQLSGAVVMFLITVIWIGRHHWLVVLKQMGRGRRGEEVDDPYLSYRVAGWGVVVCAAAAMAWLVTIGVTVTVSIFLVLAVLALWIVLARVVAETGLLFVTVGVAFYSPMTVLAGALPSLAAGQKSMFAGTLISTLFVPGMRESLVVYSSTGLRVADDTGPRPRRGALIGLILVSLLVGYLASGASTLWAEYNYAGSLDEPSEYPLNWGATVREPAAMLNFTERAERPIAQSGTQSPLLHMGLGVVVTAVLAFLRLRLDWWPIYPVGYLLWQSYPLAAVWYSVFLGWLAKVLLLKFGSGERFRAAKGFFVGLILGELAAAALWMIVALLLAALGHTFVAVRLLPG